MDHFHYKENELYAEEVAIQRIAKAVGTPFYCYSTATLVRHYHVFADGFASVKPLICFAVKANSNIAVLKTLAKEGAGADCVSEGEIRRALAAGIPGQKIVFSGVGKTRQEMSFALKTGIHQFNVESEPELELLNEVALSLGTQAPIAIRVNPDVESHTHHKITTGKKENKFGIAWDQAPEIYQHAGRLKGIRVVGISTHIGSQLTDLKPFQQAFKRLESLVNSLRSQGHNIMRLDLGGGLGISYDKETPPTPHHYAQMTMEVVKHLGCELIFEPGRLIAGNAGILVTEVIYVKHTPSRSFVIVDAAMNDLIRPSFYDAYHEIIPIQARKDTTRMMVADVVGPVCETGDIFAKQRTLPQVGSGELLAFRTTGAYGAVMASTYNSRLLIPEVLVKGEQFNLIRARPTYEAMLTGESLPEWL